jgi:hypothetical protein
MYKNFYLTESERERILGMHKEHGYKKPLNEQSYSDDIETDDDLHPSFDGDNKFIGMSKSMGDMEPDSHEMDELDEVEMANPSKSNDDDMIKRLLAHYGFKKEMEKMQNNGLFIEGYGNGKKINIILTKKDGANIAKILYRGPEFGNPDNVINKDLTFEFFKKEWMPVTVDNNTFPNAIEAALKHAKTIDEYNDVKPLREGWRDIFGEPDVKDAARSAYKSQGHSMMGSDDEQREGEYYTVFNGEKFFSNQIEYADYQDMGELPRVENGMLIVPNPAWES